MTETDTRVNIIDPKLYQSGWSNNLITREYYFTDGRKLIGGKRGKRYFVDYLLVYKNTNLAIIEAKAQNKDPLDGLQQSINYAQKLKIDFVYSTNGDKIYEHSLLCGKGEFIEDYPTPEELFYRKFGKLKEQEERVITHNFYFEGNKKPRFYQQIAVQKAVEAIAALNSKFIEKYQNEKAKDFIEFILEKYRKYGFKELEENKLSTLIEQSGFDRRELMASFGDFKIRDEYFELQKEIYR